MQVSHNEVRRAGPGGLWRVMAWMEVTALVLAVGASVAAVLVVRDAPARGLLVRYWTNPGFEGVPAGRLDPEPPGLPAISRLTRVVGSQVGIEWAGTLVVPEPGLYRFEIASDDGAWLYLDEALRLDNGGAHGVIQATTAVQLDRGGHLFRLRYMNAGGSGYLKVRWSPPGAALLQDIPSHLFAPDESAAGRLRTVALIRQWLAPAWALLLLYIPTRLAAQWLSLRVGEAATSGRDRAWLGGTLVAGAALLVWGITWNIGRGLDEMVPADVIDAMAHRFAHGWHLHYPLLHVLVDAIPMSGFVLADALGVSAMTAPSNVIFMALAFRVVSLLMAIGVLVLAFLCAAEVLGPARARLAPLGVLLTPVFLYYGKMANVDVPYLFWFALAMLGFIRLLRHRQDRDYLLLALGAAGAVATKDMAYGLLTLLPIGVLAAWARNDDGRWTWSAFGRELRQRRLWVAGATSLLLYGVFNNVLVNWQGYLGHLDAAAASRYENIFSPGFAGHLQLLQSTAELLVFGLGAPLAALAAAGIWTIARSRESRWALWMLVPIVSKYLTFNTLVPYNFDRFLVGEFFILAIFAAAGAEHLLRQRRRIASVLCVAGIYGWSLVYAASINAALQRDAGSAAQAWLSAHLGPGERVGYLGPAPYQPVLDGFQAVAVLPEEGVDAASPDWVVTNRQYNYRYARWPDRAGFVQALYDGTLGYVEAARFTTELPWWAVLRHTRPFTEPGEYRFSNLDKTMSDISVFRRANRFAGLPAKVERLGDERHQGGDPLTFVDIPIEKAR